MSVHAARAGARRSVWLIGMPGSGKSTVGRVLAARLGYEFVDADRELERRAGRAVSAIFARFDEEGFRRMEREVLGGLAEERGLVVGCGGGAVLDERNRAAMRAAGTVVFLDAPVDVLRGRLRIPDRSRPLLRRRRDLTRVLDERAALYRETADLIVDAALSPEEVAAAIERAL